MKNKLLCKLMSGMLFATVLASMAGCGETKPAQTSSGSSSGSASTSGENKPAESQKPATEAKTNEPVLLRIFMYDQKGTDDAKVAEAINNLKQVQDIGVKIEIVKGDTASYAERLPLLLSSDEQMDMCFDAGWIQYVERVKAGAYMDISQLIEKTPKLKEAIPQTLWNGVKIDGKIYGVPTYKEIGEQWHMMVDATILKECGFTKADLDDFTKYTPLLKAYKEKDKGVLQLGSTVGAYSSAYLMDKYDSIDGLFSPMFVVKRDDPTKIVNAYETDDYKEGVELVRSWFNEGYITPDVLTRENYNEYMDGDNFRFGCQLYSYAPLHELTVSGWYGRPMDSLPVTPAVITNTSTRGSIFVLPQKSKNPEKALQFLEVWNTDPEVRNLIRYGIEGTHYTLVDGQVKTVENVGELYSTAGFSNGNVFICKTAVGESKDKTKSYEEFNKQCIESVCLGFTPDNTKINDKLTACTAVVAEYGPMIQTGAVDPNENLPKFLSALKDAGIDDILKEYQAQYDAWLKVK